MAEETLDIDERAEEVRDSTASLAADIAGLAAALDDALADMERLRQQATALQRELMAANSRDPNTAPAVLELGWLMRRIQESGRLLETVCEPLRLSSKAVADDLGDVAERIATALQEQS